MEVPIQQLIEWCYPTRLFQNPNSTTYIGYDFKNRVISVERDFTTRVFEYDENDLVIRIEEFDFYSDSEAIALYEYDDQSRIIKKTRGYVAEGGGGDTTVLVYEHYQDSILVRTDEGIITTGYFGLNEFNKPGSVLYYDNYEEEIDLYGSEVFKYDEFGNVIERELSTLFRGTETDIYEYNYDLDYIDIDPTPELFSQHDYAITNWKSIGGTFDENYTYVYDYYPELYLLQVTVIDSTFADPDPDIYLDSQYFFTCDE